MASKYFKRIEPFWIKKSSAAEVFTFLEDNGLQPKKTLAAVPKLGTGKTTASVQKTTKAVAATAGGSGGGGRDTHPPINEDDPPGGSFHLWPGKIAVNRFYDLRVKVVNYDGEMSVFELLDVSPAIVQ